MDLARGGDRLSWRHLTIPHAGLDRVPAGSIPILLDVRDQMAHESYGVQALTMDEGHTLEELVSYQQEASFPLWAHHHGFVKAAQGTTQ